MCETQTRLLRLAQELGVETYQVYGQGNTVENYLVSFISNMMKYSGLYLYFYFTIHSPAKKMPSSTEFILSLLTVTSIMIQYYTSTLLDLKFLNKLIKCAIILLKPILCTKHL